jgi:hypothetical protein
MVTGRAGKFGKVLLIAATMAIALAVSFSQAEAREISQEETAAVESRLTSANSASAAGLASALGVEAPSQEPPPDSAQDYLQDLGDLDGDGIPEYLLEWLNHHSNSPAPTAPEGSEPSWALFLLDWDGARWQALPMMGGFEPFTVLALPATKPGERAIAVVVLAGATEIPYPAVFRFQAHSVTLLWDGRSDESRYEGYDHGGVKFRLAGGTLEMIATGRADPGLLIFPKSGARGFDARTAYKWVGQAFIPTETEYSANGDFTLYRFIAALHLRDFRTAYSLIDPAKFLRTENTGLPAFRKLIEDTYPEFLSDKIFRAQDSGPGDESFKLELTDKVYVYTPIFSGGPRFLLTGLERQEHKPEDE